MTQENLKRGIEISNERSKWYDAYISLNQDFRSVGVRVDEAIGFLLKNDPLSFNAIKGEIEIILGNRVDKLDKEFDSL